MAEDTRKKSGKSADQEIDPEQKFQEELSWCIDYLETTLATKKVSDKQGNKKAYCFFYFLRSQHFDRKIGKYQYK